MKKIVGSIRDAFEDRLRWLCALLAPEKRLVVILVFILLGAAMNLYFIVYTIRNWNKPQDAGSHRVEHLEPADMGAGRNNFLEKHSNTDDYEEKELEEAAG